MPNPWTLVTKGFVIGHKDENCDICKGEGHIEEQPCACAVKAFRLAFPPGSPRIKISMQRIGNRDVERIYYRTLAAVDNNEIV